MSFCIIRLFQSSTCYEQTRAHHQVSCINTASDIVTLCKWPSGMQAEQVPARPAYRPVRQVVHLPEVCKGVKTKRL